MVTLNALNSASTLLQQISSNTRPQALTQKPLTTLEQTVAGVSPATGSATKSLSSTIFNAVSAVSEKQDETVKAVLDYLEETYTNIEERFASAFAAMDPSTAAGAIQSAKSQGERLKQQVLADPSTVHKIFEQIRAARPDTSTEGVMSLLVVELNNRAGLM